MPLVLLTTAILTLLAAGDFWVRTFPRLPSAGDRVIVMCRVPPAAENRSLRLGVEGWTSSEFGLEGKNAPAIHERTFDGIPCEAGAAFCEVRRADGSVRRASAYLNVRCPLR
jgi:hypothetical protein